MPLEGKNQKVPQQGKGASIWRIKQFYKNILS